MSTKALFWAMEQNIPPGPKLVLIYLADWYDKEKEYAWPKYRQLAERTNMGVSTVRQHMDWLVDHGVVLKEKQIRNGRQIQNRYRLPINVMAFQGARFQQAGVPESGRQGAEIQQPSNTLKNTPKDTLTDAGASQEANLKHKKGGTISDNLQTVDSEMWGMDKDEALLKVRKGILPDGSIKFSALEKLWKYGWSCASETNYGTYVKMSGKEKGQLMHAWDKLGEDMLNIVWEVMSDWAGFTKACERDGTAFNSPTKPNVIYFTQNLSIAVDFTAVTVGSDGGWDDI